MLALIVDDHPLFRTALAQLVRSVLGEMPLLADSAEEGLRFIQDPSLSIGLVILDLGLPGLNGLEAVRHYYQVAPDLPLVVVSGQDTHFNAQNVGAVGAAGFISKAAPVHELSALLRQFTADMGGQRSGQLQLTRRQGEILRLLADGISNREISRQSALAEVTVKMHITALFRVFGVKNRTHLVLAAQMLCPELLHPSSAETTR